MRVIYWSEYRQWLQCQRWWFYAYVEKNRPFEKTPAMELGSAIDAALNNRMRARSHNPIKEWKPTAKYNPGMASMEGLTVVLREYDALWGKDDLGNDMVPQVARTKQVLPGLEIAAVVDGLASGWIRETKVTEHPDWPSYKHQLLWNTMASSVSVGELDIILKPGFNRPEWAFERRRYQFTAPERDLVILEVRNFQDSVSFSDSSEEDFPRNSNACRYCPHTKRCWGEL